MLHENSFIRNIVRFRNRKMAPVIAEIKPYSLTKGDLIRGRNVVHIAEEYIEGGAACLSIVTGKWYHGNIELLKQIAMHVNYPILRKDFIINFKQIKASKEMGASAVLLTKKLLQKEHLNELAEYALSIDVIPFVEVSDEDEIAELTIPGRAILAVNNKNICMKETDEGDIGKSIGLLNCCKTKNAALCVSASAIKTQAEVIRLLNAGFDAVLVGTALLESQHVRDTIRKFTSLKTD